MQRYSQTFQTTRNGVVTLFVQPTITVYLAGTNTLATIFSDNAGTALANPFDGSIVGAASFYAVDGRYDVKASRSGYEDTWDRDVLLRDPRTFVVDAANTVNAATLRLQSGDIIRARGLNTPGDGGGGIFHVLTATAGALTGMVIIPAGDSTLRLVRDVCVLNSGKTAPIGFTRPTYLKEHGFVMDGVTNDTARMKELYTFARNNNNNTVLRPGHLWGAFSSVLDGTTWDSLNGFSLKGEQAGANVKKRSRWIHSGTDTRWMLNLRSTSEARLEGIHFFTSTPNMDNIILFSANAVNPVTVTIDIPTSTFTLAGHNFANGDPIKHTTSGSLPTGLTASATVYVTNSNPGAGTYQVSLTDGGAAISLSGTQSGVQKVESAFATNKLSTLYSNLKDIAVQADPTTLTAAEMPTQNVYLQCAGACQIENLKSYGRVALRIGAPTGVDPLTGGATIADGRGGDNQIINPLLNGDLVIDNAVGLVVSEVALYTKQDGTGVISTIKPGAYGLGLNIRVTGISADASASGTSVGVLVDGPTHPNSNNFVVEDSTTLSGKTVLIRHNRGSGTFLRNRPVSDGGFATNTYLYIGPDASDVTWDVCGRDSYLDAVNVGAGVNAVWIDDRRTYALPIIVNTALSGNVTAPASAAWASLLSIPFKSGGEPIRVTYNLCVQHKDAAARLCQARVLYDGAVLSDRLSMQFTGSVVNGFFTMSCSVVVTPTAKDSAKTLVLQGRDETGAAAHAIFQGDASSRCSWTVEYAN